MLWTIVKHLASGDMVLCPDGTGKYLVGEITGDYYYRPGEILPHRRPVQWLDANINRTAMSQSLRSSASSIGTTSNLTQHAVEIETLLGRKIVIPDRSESTDVNQVAAEKESTCTVSYQTLKKISYSRHSTRNKINRNAKKHRRTHPCSGDDVQVDVVSYPELFDISLFPLALDTYQRPFVWGKDKIEQMIEDLAEFTGLSADSPDYYMGTLLLHKNREKGKRFVIDGQQRLTSLLVLQAALIGGIPERQDFIYRSLESAGNIKAAQAFIDDAKHKFKRNRLFERICFTVITVDSEDLAFTFFDTQNHRGVPLDATDLLKAYHLRAIRGSSDVALQTKCATMWESMQHYKQIIGNRVDFAPALFNRFLWRARCWTGQKNLAQETYGSIMHEFQERPILAPADNTVPLYPTHRNIHAASLVVNPDSNLSLIKQPTPDKQHRGELFTIRQPISKGVGFFLYTAQYATLLQKIINEETEDPNIRDFKSFYDQVISSLSHYLRELYLLAILMYVDQFSTRHLLSFALWLDHVLGAIRLYKQYIFRQAPMIYLRDSSRNFLDVIAGAFTTEEVIEFLKADSWADSVYRDETRKPVEPGVGVQGVYMKKVMNYYGKTESIRNKRKWIEEKLS